MRRLDGGYADAVIVVIDQGHGPTGVAVARAAAAAGGAVELVARVADDPAGDRWLHGLTEAGIGHVATLRQPAGATRCHSTPRISSWPCAT